MAELERSRRRYEQVVAATWARHGASYGAIGRRLGIDRKTAKRRALDGEQLLEDDPDSAQRYVAEYLRPLVTGEDPVQTLATALLDPGQHGALEAAARLFESRGAP